jgi:tetratricopeptide (TPR) repeat protein
VVAGGHARGEAYGAGATGLPRREARQRAREAATKALALDPDLGEAHASLATVLVFEDWDLAGAEREFSRAISHLETAALLGPLPPGDHQLLGEAYRRDGQLQRAFDQYVKGHERNGATPAELAAIKAAIATKGWAPPPHRIAAAVKGCLPFSRGLYNRTVASFRGLPGSDLIADGLRDLEAHIESPTALLVSIGAPRLRELGLDVPRALPNPEHRLYRLLAAEDADAAHGRYNALVRRLVSFEHALACVK